ncbi:phosphatidylinositol 3,4,5-trisphosphate 3-phosphatase TPTE2-like isoform X1 [Pollicipes pollicipes]|uniref:phosphatidylinositol 3,4,5-trisphosphate 3-phosphatase TPTE2-like isoform X1 n=1 Tax=Pollicipes pollicipes TaxID=41117 RepID=UPI00188504C4|nr:phosphatidylinositol 3,4,5-trisphosphate 3-phosphatase TPTE2-like isoform X1 [Pollicipes pollicipes]
MPLGSGVNASQHAGFDAGENPAKVIQRASLFFVQPQPEDAAQLANTSKEATEAFLDLLHPSLEPEHGTLQYIRWTIKKVVDNIFFRLLFAMLIIADIALMIIDLGTRDMDQHLYYIVCSFTFSWFFVIEICLRVVAFSLRAMFHFWYNIVDVFIIIASTIGTSYLFVDRIVSGQYYIAERHRSPFWYFIFSLRFCRMAHFFRLYQETENIKRAARQLVSQNKRRYHDDGFDLDLTYVTERVIAMSFPSSGHMTFYRNPITEVARFFETKHGGHYKIYNLCKERGYDDKIFDGQVERFFIEDHNPPTCKDMLKFAAMSSEWLEKDEKNVIAVHCKGGKGRTGTMICVYLVDNGLFSTAEDSLSYFGYRRTDLSQGDSFQGVETPSQCRYVGYYEAIRNHKHRLPTEVELTLRSIRIWGMATVGKGDGSDITLVIESPEEGKVYENHFGKGSLRLYDKEDDELFVTFQSVPAFKGDIRFKFKCSSRRVPRGYEKTAWFFWFHTGFIQHNRLKLERSDLDNPHKSKTWEVFRESFGLECIFQKTKTGKIGRQGKLNRFSRFLVNKGK